LKKKKEMKPTTSKGGGNLSVGERDVISVFHAGGLLLIKLAWIEGGRHGGPKRGGDGQDRSILGTE